MSRTTDLGFNSGYFTEPDDNANFDFAGYAEWSLSIAEEPDPCVICREYPGNVLSAICDRCEHDEGAALERDRMEAN